MKRPDLNDTLRTDGVDALRARMDSARPYKPNGTGKLHVGTNETSISVSNPLLMKRRDFVAGYVAPDYMIEGIIQPRRIYSLTGRTGDGKTAIQLYLAYLLATGSNLGQRHVEKCRVLYLAGE